MDEYHGQFDPEWCSFLRYEDIRNQPWVTITTAFTRLKAWEDEPQNVAIEYLQSGVWTASFGRARIRGGPKQMSAKPVQILHRLGEPFTGECVDQALGTGILERKFWMRCHEDAGAKWVFETSLFWPEGARIDVERGEVEALHGIISDAVKDDEFLAYRITAYAVSISEYDVDATAPLRGNKIDQLPRRSTFDWEAAFADVAADFYFDLEFEDVGARGVQTKIVDALRESFERRNLRVPELSSLKSKAKILVGALRSKRS